jgi:ABC-2 type transport system permease protein
VILSGVLAWWYFGRLAAIDRLEPPGTGAAHPAQARADHQGSSRRRRNYETALRAGGVPTAGFCLGFGAIPCSRRRVVPAIFLLTEQPHTKSWFLAPLRAAPWPWLVVAGMAALGVGMYTYGGLTYYNARKVSPAEAGSPAWVPRGAHS